MNPDLRLQGLLDWLRNETDQRVEHLEPASADASFRRYFRVFGASDQTRIVMDAPPEHEDLPTYLKVTTLLQDCGLHVPEVFAANTARGYALLEDLGGTHLLTALSQGHDVETLYGPAMRSLSQLQLRGEQSSQQLAAYDAAVLQREMQLMPEWFCVRHLQIDLHSQERLLLATTFAALERECLSQPRVFVHRDYHSRNLMICADRPPGVIDFQDALRGPVGYDLASLLKDCYVEWPRARVVDWVNDYREQLLQSGAQGQALAGETAAQFLRWFDMVGLQRHIKVLGIFARLCWRDGKPGYLNDLPRTLGYVRQAAAYFPETAAFADFTEKRLAPMLVAANERARASAAVA